MVTMAKQPKHNPIAPKKQIPTVFKNTNQPYSKHNPTVFKNASNRIQNACDRILGKTPNRIFFAGVTTEIATGLGSKNAQAKTLSGNTVGGAVFWAATTTQPYLEQDKCGVAGGLATCPPPFTYQVTNQSCSITINHNHNSLVFNHMTITAVCHLNAAQDVVGNTRIKKPATPEARRDTVGDAAE